MYCKRQHKILSYNLLALLNKQISRYEKGVKFSLLDFLRRISLAPFHSERKRPFSKSAVNTRVQRAEWIRGPVDNSSGNIQTRCPSRRYLCASFRQPLSNGQEPSSQTKGISLSPSTGSCGKRIIQFRKCKEGPRKKNLDYRWGTSGRTYSLWPYRACLKGQPPKAFSRNATSSAK